VYISENREQIREHIGRLMHGSRFLKGVIASVGAADITLTRAARFGADHYTGAVASFINGPALGMATYIAASEPGTGKLTLLPVPAIMPVVGNKVEVWPEETDIEDVNDAINLAILDVQHLAATITVLTSPTIDSARKRITIPATWSMVSRLTYEYGGYKFKLRPRDPRDRMPWDQVDQPETFDIEGSAIVVWGGIPTSATNLRLVGYTLPVLLADDTTATPVRSDFLVYKAASILSQDSMAGDLLDPEGSARRATFWAQQAEAKKREMNMQVLANTVRIEEAL
jgi:hypothetical protein